MKGVKFKIKRRLKKITPTQTVGIITVFLLLISIMVGYSMMDNTLDINGNGTISASTLVRISSLKIKTVTGDVDTNASVEGNIKGVMKTIFTGTGTAVFEGTVVNMGSTEAILSTINLINESNNQNPSCITMSIDGLKVGDKLTPSQEQKFTVTVTSTCTEASTKTNEFSVSYIPVNPTGGTTTIDERISNLENQINSQQAEITSLQTENDKLRNRTHNTNQIINGDFKVNQDGKTSWDIGGYTVDMWYFYRYNNESTSGTKGSASLTDGVMKLTNTDFYFTSFNSPLENSLHGKTITISAKIKSVSGNVNIGITESSTIGGVHDETSRGTTDIKAPGIVTVTTTIPKNKTYDILKLTIQAYANSSVEIEWAKMEEGTEATPFTSRTYAEEILLCKQYYRKITYNTSFYGSAGTTRQETYDFEVPMRTTPKVTVETQGTTANLASFSTTPSATGILFTQKIAATGTASISNRTYVLDARY